jgi:hypothetical protein
VDAGVGGVRIEFVGKVGEQFIRDWLKDDFDKIGSGASLGGSISILNCMNSFLAGCD